MADSDETRNSSRPRGTERQQQQQAEQENQGEEQQAERGPPDEEALRRTAENGYAGTDRDAGFTDEWAQHRDQRVMRRRDQVKIFSGILDISLFLKYFTNLLDIFQESVEGENGIGRPRKTGGLNRDCQRLGMLDSCPPGKQIQAPTDNL